MDELIYWFDPMENFQQTKRGASLSSFAELVRLARSLSSLVRSLAELLLRSTSLPHSLLTRRASCQSRIKRVPLEGDS